MGLTFHIMEKINQLKERLGADKVALLLKEVDDGILKKHQVKMIALQMGNGAHGVFEREENLKDLEHVMKLVLDRWYDKVLDVEPNSNANALDLLVTILRAVNLTSLARRMEVGSGMLC